jgi:mannose-6-phosphate isomerase-like protein (cupin superfamily)
MGSQTNVAPFDPPRLTAEPWHVRVVRVKSCGPSGSQDLAFVGPEIMEYFPIADVGARLEAGNGGWEVVHESPNLEVGVLVRKAPTPDPPVRHTADEVYVVLAGEATLEADGESRRLRPGDAAFVAVGKEHHFVDYELISVLVLFARGN